MKLVIDITDEMWQAVQDGWVGNKLWHSAIENGTPLPKGHGNLKDVDSIFNEGFPKADINAECEDNKKEYPNWLTDITGLQSVLKNAPTIIEADKEESEDKE